MGTLTYHEYSNVWEAEGKYPIAHCIAKDARMGAGFAAQVSRKYPEVRKTVLESKPQIGDCVVTDIGESKVFINMVTKRFSSGKPTEADFTMTVNALSKLGYKEIHMPFIGTGLDKLSKEFVEGVLTAFAINSKIDIHVHLEREKDF